MAKGYYLVLGDKTTCGGKILGGDPTHTLFGKAIAREQEPVTCGQHPGIYMITGHIPGDSVMGRKFAGTLHSKSSCPCQARFVPSMINDAYEFVSSMGGTEPEQHAQSAKKDNIHLDYQILLKGVNILTPLQAPDYKEMINGSATNNTEKVEFQIINKGDEAEGLSLEVIDGNDLIYSEKQTGKFFESGEHFWNWDGYSNEGILDTRRLKSKSLIVRLIALKGDKMLKVDYRLKNSSKEQEWVDVKVDRNTFTAEIFWRVAFKNGGVDGDNSLLQPISYSDLEGMAKDGIEYYWSRNGSRSSGIGNSIATVKGNYKVKVSVSVNVEPAMPSFKLTEVLESDYGRSTSLAGFRKVCHNLGYYYERYVQQLEINYLSSAESRFKMDSAHEMGHIVLDKYGDGSSPDYSWSHKGTSSVMTQEPLGGFPMPRTGEIDLMKYSDNPSPSYIQFLNSIAASDDVKGLIWLSRVKFNG